MVSSKLVDELSKLKVGKTTPKELGIIQNDYTLPNADYWIMNNDKGDLLKIIVKPKNCDQTKVFIVVPFNFKKDLAKFMDKVSSKSANELNKLRMGPVFAEELGISTPKNLSLGLKLSYEIQKLEIQKLSIEKQKKAKKFIKNNPDAKKVVVWLKRNNKRIGKIFAVIPKFDFTKDLSKINERIYLNENEYKLKNLNLNLENINNEIFKKNWDKIFSKKLTTGIKVCFQPIENINGILKIKVILKINDNDYWLKQESSKNIHVISNDISNNLV